MLPIAVSKSALHCFGVCVRRHLRALNASWQGHCRAFNHACTQVIRRDGQLALSEVTHREGILAGSSKMDDMFMEYAKNRLGVEEFTQWAESNPRDVAVLKHKAWEEVKTAFDGTEGAMIDPMPSLVRAISEEVCHVNILGRHLNHATLKPAA